jgi:ABC-2 type transport system permease protein
VRRMARVYRQFFLSSLQREMEFRANFVAKVAQDLIWVVTFVLLLEVIFRNTATVRGWTKEDTYLLAATCFIVEGLVGAFLSASTVEIPQKVRQGTLDFDIVKPIDSQFLACARRFNFDQLGTVIAGFAIALIASRSANIELTLGGVSAYLVLVGSACVIYGSFLLMLMTTAVWFVRVDNLWVLGDLAIALARYPIDIFDAAAKAVLTFVVPLAFLATVPVRVLSGTPNAVWLALGVAWAAVFLILARWFWRFALRYYTSASS